MASARSLLLLDGHSLAYRAFYALPVENFSTATGQPTNAVYGFTSMLINALRDEQPTHLAVAFDVSRTTFRSERYPDYKANRAKTPDEFKGQVSLIKEVLEALQIPVVEVDGYEADDVIATLSTQASAGDFDVAIITGDRDTFQLVSDRVTVLYPRKGVSDLARMTPAAVEEKYGLTPAQYPDFAALRGDPSDNLPGIPGVGEKTATKWISEFGSFDAAGGACRRGQGKGGRCAAGQPRAGHHQPAADRAGAGRSAGPAPRRPRQGRLGPRAGAPGLRRTRVPHPPRPTCPDAAERERAGRGGARARGRDPHVRRPGAVARQSRRRVGRGGGPGPMGLGRRRRRGPGPRSVRRRCGRPLARRSRRSEAGARLAGWLRSAELVLHDANGPMLALAAQGVPMSVPVFDTAVAAYLLRPDQRSYDLADLAVRWLHRDLTTASDDGQLSFDTDARCRSAADPGRARAGDARSGAALKPEVEAIGAASLLADVELPLTGLLVAMERVGIAVDVEALDALRAEFAAEVKRAAEPAYAVIGHEVNLGSPKQLQVVLFDELGMPKTKRTKTGYTTDADALTWLFAQTEHPFLAHLLRHRDVSKLLVTVEGLQRAVADDGRIHTTFMQTVAATGRLSSTDPNLQNIPVRTEEGRRIRSTFCVGEGYDVAHDRRLQPGRDADHGAPV